MNVPVILLSLVVAVLACWAIWSHLRLRRLTRVVEKLAAGSDAKDLLAKRWRFRFGMKSLLIALTLFALVMGLIGSELHRVRMQRDALDSIGSELTADVAEDYRSGWLGVGFVGTIARQWFDSDWGWHAQNLSISTMNYNKINSLQLQPPITSYNMEKLGGVTSLEAVQIMGVDLTTRGTDFLKHLSNLRRLSLVNCRLPNTALADIAKCKELEHLQLHRCHISKEDLLRLTALPKLSSLDLAYTDIDDRDLEIIGQLSELRALNLDGTRVTDAGLKQLLGLKHLGWLSVGETRIGDTGVSYLLEVPTLHELRLFNTQATPECRDFLQTMPALHRVWLYQTQ